MAIWTPQLSGRTGPKYRQIVDAIAEDIASGVLPPGARLPPQRILAYALGISPNTTSRAYADAVSRGLLRGETGRGTYVRRTSLPVPPHAGAADLLRPAEGPIDLSRNLPAPGRAASFLRTTLAGISRAAGLQSFLDYQSRGDLVHHGEAAIAWLALCGVDAGPGDVVVTCGAQNGLLVALMATMKPGELLLTEALTYAPVRAMADQFGLRLASVVMDEGGLCPRALDEVCRARVPKALYLMPNLQTPTTLTMNADRRGEIAAIARRHGLLVIEDDVFGLLKPERPKPIAALLPDQTIYITTTSKCLSPGLRVGFIRAPVAHVAALRGAVNLSTWMPPPLMVEIAARWIADGTAQTLIDDQRTEAAARQEIAASVFGGLDMRADPEGFHMWLPLPPHWPPDDFRAEAARRGVEVAEAAIFAAEPSHQPRAVRLALSHEPSHRRLETGLTVLRDLLSQPGSRRTWVI